MNMFKKFFEAPTELKGGYLPKREKPASASHPEIPQAPLVMKIENGKLVGWVKMG